MVMQAQENTDTLGRKVGRWRTALADAATGPLVVAGEIVALAARWEEFREEAGDLSCTSFLREKLGRGRGLAYFTKRHDAVQKLGEACRRTMHHDVAIYVANNVPDQYIDQVKLELMRGCRQQNNNPLTVGQAERRIRLIMGKSPEPKRAACSRCAKLEALLTESGIELPG